MALPPYSSGSRVTNVRRTSAKKRRHQHLLETGVRSSEADRQRKRWWFGLVAKLFIATVVFFGAYIGISRLVAHTILQNPQYNIAELEVETDGVLKAEDILEASDLHRGENIFRVDLAKAQARVASIPQVEKVLVSRQLPNRVAIQVNERKPVAWIAPANSFAPREVVVASKSAWLVDSNGILMHPKKRNPPDLFLPIIRNYNEGNLTEGQEANSEEVKASLDLLRAQQESTNTARFQIEEIDLGKHFGLVVTDRNGLHVLFGLDEMDRQLKRLDVYLQALDQHTQKPQTINLLVQRNVPVTLMVDAVATDKPVSTPQPATASPNTGGAAAPTKEKAKSKSKEKPKAPEKSKEKAHSKSVTSENTHHRSSTTREQPFLLQADSILKAQSVHSGH